MITDNIKNARLYYSVSPRLKKALEFLEQVGKEGLKERVEIDGSDVFAFPAAYTSKKQEDSVWEAHRNYIDVQYIVDGNECIGYEYIENLEVTKEYDEKGDALLLKGEGTMVKCSPGLFMVLFPEDAHMPGVQDSCACDMKKIIVKVRV